MANMEDQQLVGLGPWRSRPTGDQFELFPAGAVEGSVGRRFLEAAEQHQQRLALNSPSGRWTFAELSNDATRLAGGIQAELGLADPKPVAVLADHDGPLVLAILGVVLSGHIVVVLDPAAPAASTRAVLEECAPALILHDLAQTAPAEQLNESAGLHVAARRVDQLHGEFIEPERVASDPVLLAFTSGTSGSSKGAVITHGVILNLVRGATNTLGISSRDRMPMLFPASLAVAAYPMFLPLLNGGALATLDVRSVGLEPIADFLEREQITLAYMAPTVVRFLVDALAGRQFPALRMIALGGELVDNEVVELSNELFHPELLANGFGTTETGVIALYVFALDELDGKSVPVGYPVEDVELLILDENGAAVPEGRAGEIAVASPYIFSGYWGHPELSAQVIFDDPLGRTGWKMYRTGDLGRLDRRGALEVLGRLDTKVKIRGRFVVLGDVEALVHELDGVADGAVFAHSEDGIVELHAIVTPAGGAVLEPMSLRAKLLEEHESFRVPTRWTVVDELPRLPNGKLDRRALSDRPTAPRARASDVRTPPPSPSEPSKSIAPHPVVAGSAASAAELRRVLLELWRTLLPTGGVVGIDDDFFHLGGDSLLAAQMLVMAEERSGITVPMSALLHATTIRSLAGVFVEAAAEQQTPTSVQCVQPGDESTSPRLWFIHDLPGSAYRVRHLARSLGPDQPVWSFESPLLRGEPNPDGSLSSFAARYVQQLKACQPEGPYWLAGYSFGGICAYEMARQLVFLGDDIAFLGIVDVGPGYRGPNWTDRHSPPWPWFGVPGRPDPSLSVLRRFLTHFETARRNPAGAARHWMIRSGIHRTVDPVRFRLDLRRLGRVRPSRRLWYAWEEHWKLATRSWDRKSEYSGVVDLFWASQTGSTDGSMGWGPLVGELRIHRFKGFHDHLLEEHGAAALADAMRHVIDARMEQPSGNTA